MIQQLISQYERDNQGFHEMNGNSIYVCMNGSFYESCLYIWLISAKRSRHDDVSITQCLMLIDFWMPALNNFDR